MKILKIFICIFVLIASNRLIAQESLMTNYFKPSDAEIRGNVDSIFQVDFYIYDGVADPSMYLDYIFDKNGNLIYYSSLAYGTAEPISIQSVCKKGVTQYELVSFPYYDADTNKFVHNSNAQIVEINGAVLFNRIKYDDKGRISQIDVGYVADNYTIHTLNYKYITNDTYTITVSADGNIYATQEYVKGKYSLEIIDNILGGSDISTYIYNEKGDIIELQVTAFNGDETIYKYVYEYDDRSNWIKKTQWIQYGDEAPFFEQYSTRKLFYSDGISTGYEVQY